MSHEVTVHEAQTRILRELLFVPAANFAQLQKPTGLDSDHFKFHIARLVELGYVAKTDDGYTLTHKGKEHANKLDTDTHTIERQAKLSVALIIEDDKGRFLSQERLKQPYFGFWGRPTGKMRWGETFIEAAARELMEEANIEADLEVAGFYHKMDYKQSDKTMLEDKLFCIVYGKNPQGDFVADMEGHHNEWLSNEDLAKKDKVFQSVPEITAMGHSKHVEFIEHPYFYTDDEY